MDTTAIALSISAGGLLFSILVFVFARMGEAKGSARENGAASAWLSQINARLSEIVTSIAKQDGRIEDIIYGRSEDRERIVKVEESVKNAHKRIDEIVKCNFK